MTNRYHSFIDNICKDAQGNTLGIIKDAYTEGSDHWFIIDNDYEVKANGCEEVIDLVRNECYIRLSQFALGCSFKV